HGRVRDPGGRASRRSRRRRAGGGQAGGRRTLRQRGRRQMRTGWRRRISSYVLPALILAGWEVATRLGVFPAHVLPAPSTVLQTLYLEARSGELWAHIAASTWRVLAGFAIGTAIAVALGTVVGLSRGMEAFLDPTLQGIRSIPTLGWVPLLLLWMGIGEAPKLTLIAVGDAHPQDRKSTRLNS